MGHMHADASVDLPCVLTLPTGLSKLRGPSMSDNKPRMRKTHISSKQPVLRRPMNTHCGNEGNAKAPARR
eukprot:3520197-Pleurochrysis_carterae.AAC.6